MIDALRQASVALSESELLFGEGLSALEPLRELEDVKSALSQALMSSATDSPQALSTLHTGSMPSQCTSSRCSSDTRASSDAPYFGAAMTASLPQQLGLQRKSISIPIQRKDFVPPHLISIKETSDPMNVPHLSSSYCAGFRPGSVTQGKGRKLSGFDAVRFRNKIMRQTGFIEPDTQDR